METRSQIVVSDFTCHLFRAVGSLPDGLDWMARLPHVLQVVQILF